jgi:hypothetical protein
MKHKEHALVSKRDVLYADEWTNYAKDAEGMSGPWVNTLMPKGTVQSQLSLKPHPPMEESDRSEISISTQAGGRR